MKILLDINVLKLDEKIVIDARRTVSELHPKGWVDAHAFDKVGTIWKALRKAYLEERSIEEALKDVVVDMYQLSREELDPVEIVGGLPEHWKETQGRIKLR
ncbi:MAG: hypothetical protein AAB490_06145 [Patescibacteria group bacterium]